jgi:hypothetical protein
MLGIVNRALEFFVRDTYGPDVWADIVAGAELGLESFEAMLSYRDETWDDVLAAAVGQLGKGREAVLEDLGHYLAAHPRNEVVRRLLRFGGCTFDEFLTSLEELPDRVRLVLPELGLPDLTVHPGSGKSFWIRCGPGRSGFCHLLSGMIRAMADDYGALVMIEMIEVAPNGAARLMVTLHESSYSAGRTFDLSARIA